MNRVYQVKSLILLGRFVASPVHSQRISFEKVKTVS